VAAEGSGRATRASTPGPDVALAYLHPPEVGHNFTASLVHTVAYDLVHSQRIGELIPELCSSGAIVTGRNAVAQVFLDHLDLEWLWWVDADMGWKADALDRLLATADPAERPVVGGLCFAWRDIAPDNLNGFRQVATPTIYDWIDVEGQGRRFKARDTYPADTVLQCAATGSAMVLIHRSALEKVRAENGDHWYDRIPVVDGYMGEDISFCARLGAAGVPVHVDTSVRTNHMKRIYVSDC